MSRTLLVSFSGDRTSAYMTNQLLTHRHELSYQNIIVIFANTGCEDENTLNFINECDNRLGFKTVWLEGETHPVKGKGMIPKIVDFKTASRNGEPYEAMIKKGGIPNVSRPICTRDLKERTITNYMRKIGYKRGSYDTAIGIRADEVHRISARMVEYKIVYPLVQWWPTSKMEILDFWKRQKFDLDLKEYEGNCLFCFKKSWRKLLTLASERPEVFDFPLRMERLYSLQKQGTSDHEPPFHFYRDNLSTADLLAQAAVGDFEKWSPRVGYESHMDDANGCSESCEIYPDK